jgi:large subunit ribosomal protein L25
MIDVVVLAAEPRPRSGKGGARACRRAQRIPAVVYGSRKDPELISLSVRDLQKELRRPGFLSHIYEIEFDGRRQQVLPREVQLDPVTDRPIHIDFLRVGAETRVHVDVAVAFVNEAAAPGLKGGGVLNVVAHTVELVCIPSAIPERLEVDLSGLDIGDVIHAGQLTLPAGVELAPAVQDATIASIAPPTVAAAEEAPAAPETTAPAT